MPLQISRNDISKIKADAIVDPTDEFFSGSGGTDQIIHAYVPLSEMFGYTTDLRSRTQGRGMFTMQFDRYEEVPGAVAQKVIAESKANLEEDE